MKTTRSQTLRLFATLGLMGLSCLALSCKSPLFGLGGLVDTAVPGVSVSQVEESGTSRELVNGDYVRGVIVLRGTATDDIGITSVVLSFDENGVTVSSSATVDATAQTWSASIDTTLYIDGDKDFTVTVTDTASKTTTSRFVLYFDNKPPTVLLTVPSADEGISTDALYGTIDIKGSAADQFGIRKVRVFLYRASDGALLYSSPDDASIGTNSFALQLDTSALVGKTSSERGYVYVRAWDRSGNTNTQFYRLDEIKALNANLGATVEELHALETGTSTGVNGLSLTQVAGARRYEPGTGYEDARLVSYYFDQSSNLPIITVSNPEEGKTAAQNLLSKSARAMGLVQDVNGVELVEIQFKREAIESIWYSDSAPGTDGDVLDVSGTGKVVNWTTKILWNSYGDSGFGALAVEAYSIRVRATDADGNQRVSDWVPFTIDADVPDITITSPEAGDYLKGDPITFSGAATSYGTATIQKVELAINGIFDYRDATLAAPGTQSSAWSFDISSALVPLDGTYTIKARVTDSGVKQALYNIVVTIDRTAPNSLSFISPTKGSSVNGYPTLMGQAKDNILLDKVYLVYEKPDPDEEILLADTYNWSYELDAGTLANTTYGYNMGNNIYRVPFRVKAVDQAGNIAWSPAFGTDKDAPGIGSYYLDVDLDGDKPEITNIVSPGEENTAATPYLITGSIKFQGTATDDDGLHHVEMALIALSGVTESWRNLDGTPGAAGAFHTVNGTTLWSYVLNESGALYALSDISGHAGDFKIIVRAVDMKNNIEDVTGNEKTIYVRFDNTLPGVIDLAPEEGTIQSGTFPLIFTAQDNNSIIMAQVSYNNGTSYSTLALTAGANSPQEYDFSVPVNSKTVNSGAFATSSGTLYMRIRLKDEVNITEKSFKYLIDNIAPVNVTAPSTVSMSAISNQMYTDAGASLAEIIGVVNDTGTVRGIDRVEVYFERAGQIYRLNPMFAAASIASTSTAFSNGSFLYPDTSVVGYEDYIMTINKAENYNDAVIGGGDDDGYQESITQGTGGYTWGARFDSSKISDGDVTVHYVAWDNAGNASHFQIAGIVKNNPPVLATMTIGTDLNGDADATDDGERIKLIKQANGSWRGYTLNSAGTQLGTEQAYDLSSSIMTVRNSLLTFSATVSGGNTPITYSLLAPDATPLLNWTSSSAYSETAFSGLGWTENAINTLTLSAKDTAYGTSLQTDPLSFKVTIDNTDGTAPYLSVAPVGSKYAEPASGQSQAYASRGESAVAAYSDNVYWTDVDADGTCDVEERQGRVELAADSTHNGTDADVSGIVTLRGKVYDDQRIGKITVAFSVAFDANGTATGGSVAAGTEIVLATFGSGTLTVDPARAAAQGSASNTLSFGLVGKNTPEIADDLGHTMNFAMTWNTAFISGVAANNVQVTIRAYNADYSLSVQQPLTVDVVPYITAISTSAAGVKDGNVRSSTGAYSVKTGATANFITVTGFNLNVDSARVTKLAVTADAGGDTLTISTAATAPWTSVKLQNDGDRSGFLTLFAAITDIPTINNLNSAATTYHGEPDADADNYLLTDDRYLRFFASNNTGHTNGYYPVMKMETNNPVFGFINLSGQYDLQVRRARASGTVYNYPLIRSLYADQMAMAVDADGMYYQFSVHNGASGNMFMIYNRYAEMYTATGGTIPGTQVRTYAGTAQPYWSWYGGMTGENYYNDASNNAIVLDAMDQGSGYMAGRYKNLQAIAKGRSNTAAQAASVYLMYYDMGTPGIIFRQFQVGQSVASNSLYAATYDSVNYNNIDINIADSDTNRSTAVSGGSQYFDFGVTDGNRVVVAYFDETNTSLKLQYSSTAQTGATPGAAVTWTQNAAVAYGYAGTYVSMHVQTDGNAGTDDPIHIAAYDSSDGDLLYVYMDSYADATPQIFKIDSYKSVGIWTDIKTNSAGTPYIAYYSSSENGTKDSIKLAWFTDTIANLSPGIDAAGKVTGDWEFMTVPVNDTPQGGLPQFARVNIDFNAANQPVVGYLADDIEWTVLLPELTD